MNYGCTEPEISIITSLFITLVPKRLESIVVDTLNDQNDTLNISKS